MSRRRLASIVVAAAGVAIVFPSPGTAQAAAEAHEPPRTAWGAPDLRGIWDFRTITPLERPGNMADKQILSEAEAEEFEGRAARRRVEADTLAIPERCIGSPNFVDCVGSYNQLWFDRGTEVLADRRSSLIVDPPDGRIPALTPEAKKRADAVAAIRRRPPRGPEDRRVGARCIVGFNSGPPMSPSAYNNNMQLFQTPEYVAILNEMVHDVRIIPLDGREHLPAHILQWMGVSRGRWEGDTLVVYTKNLTDQTMFKGSGKNMHVTERFRRLDADTLLYEYTINDPESFVRPWTAVFPMRLTQAPIYEYACHEGNYSMFNLLSGARAEEKAAAEAARKASKSP